MGQLLSKNPLATKISRLLYKHRQGIVGSIEVRKFRCDRIPAWVQEMDDKKAFMELVKANNQGELSLLEIGMHALKAVPLGEKGRGKIGGIREYARATGRSKTSVADGRLGALVYSKMSEPRTFLDLFRAYESSSEKANISDKTTHFTVISRSPERQWYQLVKLLMENDWTVKQTEMAVSIVKSSDIPEIFHQSLDP